MFLVGDFLLVVDSLDFTGILLSYVVTTAVLLLSKCAQFQVC